MTQTEKKGRFGKGKARRVIFIIIPFALILALVIIYTRRETPPEKKPDLPAVYPPVPQAEKKVEEKKPEEKKAAPAPKEQNALFHDVGSDFEEPQTASSPPLQPARQKFHIRITDARANYFD